MTDKQVDSTTNSTPPVAPLKDDFTGRLTWAAPTDEDMTSIAQLRSMSHPWKDRNETESVSLEVLTKLRPFAHIGRLDGGLFGYITIERDGPVPGAAYLRNVVVKPELRNKGLGALLLEHGVEVARDMNRKTLALRVDPSSPSVSFYRKNGFTTVATVVSKKSGKLRLLMSREL